MNDIVNILGAVGILLGVSLLMVLGAAYLIIKNAVKNGVVEALRLTKDSKTL